MYLCCVHLYHQETYRTWELYRMVGFINITLVVGLKNWGSMICYRSNNSSRQIDPIVYAPPVGTSTHITTRSSGKKEKKKLSNFMFVPTSEASQINALTTYERTNTCRNRLLAASPPQSFKPPPSAYKSVAKYLHTYGKGI